MVICVTIEGAMLTVNLRHAEVQLSEPIDKIENGEEVVITGGGRRTTRQKVPIACVVALKLAAFRSSRRTPPAVCRPHADHGPSHARAGGARSRPMSRKMSWNICF
jgi:antitoxin (DNA-binding transcriptional repressor) of toxin-antitoxin stability system